MVCLIRAYMHAHRYGRYHEQAYKLCNNFTNAAVIRPPVARRRVTSLQFDNHGVLLASGRADGHVVIYDMDEFHWTQQCRDNQTALGLARKAKASDTNTTATTAGQHQTTTTPVLELPPYIRIDTRNDVATLSWYALGSRKTRFTAPTVSSACALNSFVVACFMRDALCTHDEPGVP